MSFWIPRRDADGRLHLYTISIPLLFVVAVPCIFLAILLDLAATAPLESLLFSSSILFLGFASFLLAKISVYQTGFWFSIGSGQMTARMRRFYRLGYLLMVPGAVMTLLLSALVMRLHG